MQLASLPEWQWVRRKSGRRLACPAGDPGLKSVARSYKRRQQASGESPIYENRGWASIRAPASTGWKHFFGHFLIFADFSNETVPLHRAMMSSKENVSVLVREAGRQLRADLESLESLVEQSTAEGDPYPPVKAAIDRCVARLDELGLVGADNQLPSSELWNVAGDVLQRGWLQMRARTKPRGYAGDHEMLTWIYEERVCDDPLGRLFDRYFQEEAAPQAVRNRMRMMADWIVAAAREDRPLRISVVGSAFGLEVREALRRLAPEARQRCSVTLLDLDPEALEFARRELSPLLGLDRLALISANLFRLPKRPAMAAALECVDLLFCPGLFDYLDDAPAAAMLRAFWDRLAPGGRVTVFQFAPHNPTRTYMEWLGNWYLTYRDAAKFWSIAEMAGIPASAVEQGSEPLGVDLFLTASRP
jgi:hypothetical protein